MITRKATSHDVYRPDFRELVERGLRADEIGLVPSWPKLEALAFQSLESGLWLAAEEGGKVKAHLCSIITENPLFHGKQCTVIAWYSEIPGAGFRLFREFERWVKKESVGSVVISSNFDERLITILKKRGWTMCPSFIRVS